ncbi:helix-turn-helix domain-containing protein [Xylocopilactobacillus apicola]|uniref:helix-turn-helix domain-containing protein n=1 Tax=Xylocopilactobacillus apicola TaxID=2932184 RepID=UPI003CE561D3
MIEYYQTSGQGLSFIAAHFGIHPSQVQRWNCLFEEQSAGTKAQVVNSLRHCLN